ncbi:MAG: DUF3089 domain-containing protein [Novosphingobium sp.]|nr:DUF3089 domain-containing protein [Novosphingobium sp.]
MARKFLYLVAILVVLMLGAFIGLRYWANELSQWTFVPTGRFEAQAPLARNVYDGPAMWYSRPGLGAGDPARWLPQGASPPPTPIKAAVFFIHPTSFFRKNQWNAPLDDRESRAGAKIFVRGLASPFNGSAQLWAPRYRQATFGAFLTDKAETREALAVAYGDVLQAFDAFLRNVGPDIPIVLVGHSQGALHLMHLMQDRVAGRPLEARIAAAYVVGWPVSLIHDLPALGLPPCRAPNQAGCIMSWLSYAEPADTALTLLAYDRHTALDGQSPKGSPFLCSNPLTGSAGGAAPASANLGTLVPDATLMHGKLVPGMVGARCGHDGFLLIGSAPALGPYVLPGNDYHVYDIPLFWANVRADFARRVAAWQAAH